MREWKQNWKDDSRGLRSEAGRHPEDKTGSSPEGHVAGSGTGKDGGGHICVGAASRVRPTLQRVTCQSKDCCEKRQG